MKQILMEAKLIARESSKAKTATLSG
jgi:hypothetical protein